MTALRQEAISMVNSLPEEYLSSLIQSIKDFMEKNLHKKKTISPNLPFTQEEWDAFLNSGEGLDPKKAAAFQRLQKLLKEHPIKVDQDYDYDKVRWEALNEKYGPLD